MAAKITYTALDELTGGHISGTNYDITFAVEILDETGDYKKTTNESLDGSEEVVFLRTDRMWSFKASYITAANLLFWREFMYSVKLGETFTFYPESTGTGYQCVMKTPKYQPKRVGTTEDDFNLNLLVKEET